MPAGAHTYVVLSIDIGPLPHEELRHVPVTVGSSKPERRLASEPDGRAAPLNSLQGKTDEAWSPLLLYGGGHYAI